MTLEYEEIETNIKLIIEALVTATGERKKSLYNELKYWQNQLKKTSKPVEET